MNMPMSGWGNSTRGLGTLIAVIMRYPEISSVQYHPNNKTLSLSFILRSCVDDTAWRDLREATYEILEAYRAVTGQPLNSVLLARMEFENTTSIELIRDIQTLSVEEVGMVIEVLRDRFDNTVVTDAHDLLEEDLLLQEETIHASLEAIKGGRTGSLIALRDEGRVLVYNT